MPLRLPSVVARASASLDLLSGGRGEPLGDGVSTFILGTDDAAQLRAFGTEVAAATRELVAGERG